MACLDKIKPSRFLAKVQKNACSKFWRPASLKLTGYEARRQRVENSRAGLTSSLVDLAVESVPARCSSVEEDWLTVNSQWVPGGHQTHTQYSNDCAVKHIQTMPKNRKCKDCTKKKHCIHCMAILNPIQ